MEKYIFNNLIASEKIPGAFEKWKEYRKANTEFILKNLERCNPSKKLPVVCIWGAGESNDIDLSLLSKHAKLVLVDRDIEAMEEAKKKYKLDDAYISDIPFWHIEEEVYKTFEAMLKDGVDTSHITELLDGVASENEHHGSYIAKSPEFDMSIAIGIHSQLNIRFGALLYAYRHNFDDQEIGIIESAINGLNEVAVTKLNDLIYKWTDGPMLYGFEVLTLYEGKDESLKIIETIKNNPREISERLYLIEGVKQLTQDMSGHINYDICLLDKEFTYWNFLDEPSEKGYVMELAVFEALK